jgi:hypothetical protein
LENIQALTQIVYFISGIIIFIDSKTSVNRRVYTVL